MLSTQHGSLPPPQYVTEGRACMLCSVPALFIPPHPPLQSAETASDDGCPAKQLGSSSRNIPAASFSRLAANSSRRFATQKLSSSVSTNAPIEAGYCHSIATIMTNAAYRTGQQVVFDPKTQEVMAGGKVFKY